MQAIMLAAGVGSRLGKLTEKNTKCMIEINGKTLLERSIDALIENNVTKLIMVIGYQKENLKKYIKEKELDKKINIIYVENEEYETTNNIYSLYLTRDYLISDDTILLESDIIFNGNIITELKNCEYKNVAAVTKYQDWMSGTVIILDEENNIVEFIDKNHFEYSSIEDYYKTLCIYKLSAEYSKQYYLPFLRAYIEANGSKSNYESVLKIINRIPESSLKAMKTNNELWYEINDCQDYDLATLLFSNGTEKLELYQKRFGGYWRFNELKDFCYLVNPYFPTKQLIEKMKYNYYDLLVAYPSTMSIQNNCISRFFNIDENKLLVGNGAAELINQLQYVISGKIGVVVPTFNEYVRCFPNNEIIEIKCPNYIIKSENLKTYVDKIDALIIINPDNPTGCFISYDDMLDLLETYKNKKVIVDESFVDFADPDKKYTLMDDKILDKYPNLIVIKSIGKSYGVPGLRLGALACSDKESLKIMKNHMAVWNINSFGEYFLQIFMPFKKEYIEACEKIAYERNFLINELKKIEELEVYDSQANYLMLKMKSGDSKDLSLYLLENHRTLIKDLSTKNGINGENIIRIAVKEHEENKFIIEKIKEYYRK